MPTLTRGWTLAELVMSLTVLGAVIGLTAHIAAGQLRFVHGVHNIAAVRGQVHEVGAIIRSALWGVAPSAGDVVAATDSALDIRVAVGVAIACDSGTGVVTIPMPEPVGNTFAAFDAPLDAGDELSLLLADSTAGVWVRATLAAAPTPGFPCLASPAVAATWRLRLLEPLTIPAGSLLRLTRRVRFSHYRASDGRWYLGARDWNASSGQLNAIQPVAGPLEPHSASPDMSGLSFRYFDADGADLGTPADPVRVARVDVSARSASRRPVHVGGQAVTGAGAFVDSLSLTIALRNRP